MAWLTFNVGKKMNFSPSDYKVVVASDVSTRDGVGVEIYRGDDLLVEIFRDDTKKTREITTFSQTFSLDEMEGFIAIFREKYRGILSTMNPLIKNKKPRGRTSRPPDVRQKLTSVLSPQLPSSPS